MYEYGGSRIYPGDNKAKPYLVRVKIPSSLEWR